MSDHDLDLVPAIFRDDVDRILFSAEQIDTRLDELAAELDRDYAGQELLLICVLKGGVFVLADLVRRVTISTAMDFMACSSYGSATTSSGVVRILKDLESDIAGKHVLIVEDIVDTGLTLDYLMKNLRSRHPASLEVLTLLTKPSRREVDFPLSYVGFEVPDVFVVGYGLDFAERYRGLPHIVTLKPDVYA
jgi:hypoxanthine phosphoribosyltransferase